MSEKWKTPLWHGLGVSARGKGREARRPATSALGPARNRGPRPREKRDAARSKGERRGAGFRPEAEKDIIYISFSFSNTSNTFSNDF
jgi:hypothetical protein